MFGIALVVLDTGAFEGEFERVATWVAPVFLFVLLHFVEAERLETFEARCQRRSAHGTKLGRSARFWTVCQVLTQCTRRGRGSATRRTAGSTICAAWDFLCKFPAFYVTRFLCGSLSTECCSRAFVTIHMSPHALLSIVLLVIASCQASAQTCANVGCADLCNYHGSYVNTTTPSSPTQTGYCVCTDMHYTLDDGQGFCVHRRKYQSTALFLHLNPFTLWFAAAHFYLGHTTIAVTQTILYLASMTLYLICRYKQLRASKSNGQTSNIDVLKQDLRFCLVTLVVLLTFLVWWGTDAILFAKNTHYKDVNGQMLYAY